MGKLIRVINGIVGQAAVVGSNVYSNYKIRKEVLPFFKNKIILWFFFVNLFFLLFNFLYIFLKLRGSDELIPLHYNIYFGVDLIGLKNQIYKIPLMGLIFGVVNYFLGFLIYKQEKYASYILLGSSLLVMVVLFLASGFILNI